MNAVVTTQNGTQVTERELMDVLKNSLYPGAADASVMMVMGYCRAAGLDVMKKPVHIVPIWNKDEVKELGARWDKNAKAWFVAPATDLEPFEDWRNSAENLVSSYVDTQNATTDEISIIKQHRAWLEGDAEDGVYAGTVDLSPRLKAVLLETEDGIIVKPLTPEETAHADQLTHGQRISITEKGGLSSGQSQDRSRGR